MAYGTEGHIGLIAYDLTVQHSSGVRLSIAVDVFRADDTPTESASDAVFQALLTRIGGMNGATILAANKRGQYSVPVTP